MLKVLLNIFNGCLKLGYFPPKWNVARVMLLQKTGVDPSIVKAYRPISLLPVMSRALEGVEIERVFNFVEISMSGRQFGFTASLSTVNAICKV